MLGDMLRMVVDGAWCVVGGAWLEWWLVLVSAYG